MKYVIVRCEDIAPWREQGAALLEGAKTAHLQQLAQAGAAGVIRARTKHAVVDRFELFRNLLGLKPDAVEGSPGGCYAASAKLSLRPGETAWCCEFVTQQDGRIADLTAGRIPTKESAALIQALNEQLGSETRRWVVGDGPHHVFVTRDPSLQGEDAEALASVHMLVGQRWNAYLPKGALGASLLALLEQGMKVLEAHPVNRVRVDLGENPANLFWLWGPSSDHPSQSFADVTGRTAAVVSNSFPLRGLAATLGLGHHQGLASFTEHAFQRLREEVERLIGRHDLVAIHLSIDSADPVERLCAMERMDQLVLKPLTDQLPHFGSWRLLVAVDDQRTGAVPFVALGSGLPQQPVSRLDAQSLAESPLAFDDGAALFEWLSANT